MSNIALSIEKLSKQYRLGEIGTGTLSHDLNRLWSKLRGKEDPYSMVGQVNDRSSLAKSEYVWALKDIDFKVKEGEVLGIIGKNGAGKSTLLKLISRVTAPTEGFIKAKGRIASLLEVGTGMHPEMTARENIYLNGAILGMKRNEIAQKFDEIVEFAGCAMYIDTPVKRYSSGMRVRLGFAVAAFLEPEILIVDEVLAVGDAEFQKKAIGKMKEVSRGGGRTVLFVSHNMGSIRTLCTRAVVLEKGMQVFDGTPDDSINYYLTSNRVDMTQDLMTRTDRGGNGKLLFTEVKVLNAQGNVTQEIISGEKVRFIIRYKTQGAILSNRFLLGVTFWDKDENRVLGFSSDEMGVEFNSFDPIGEFILEIPSLAIRGGLYDVKLIATEGGTKAEHILDNISNAFTLTILPGDFWSVGRPNRNSNMVLLNGMIHHV
jgi:lipopolysaccharide transport system ATP-binding protein